MCGLGTGGGGEVGDRDEVGFQAERGHRLAPDDPPAGTVEQVRTTRDVGDARVPEVGQMADGGRDARAVVLANRRERARDVGAVERDGRKPELLQQRDPRVGEAQVGDEDAVDALRAREVAIARGLLLGVVADDLQQQRLAATSTNSAGRPR